MLSELPELSKKYGATADSKAEVANYFKKSIFGAVVEYSEFGDFISVTANIAAIEKGLSTKLDWYSDSRKRIDRKSIRSSSSIYIPSELADLISFISLNAPVNLLAPRAAKSLELKEKKSNSFGIFNSSISVTTGNQEALINFKVQCGDGSINVFSPPCANLDDNNLIPSTFVATLTSYSNIQANPLPLDTDPTIFTIQSSKVYCYNTFTFNNCNGYDGNNCTCTIKASIKPINLFIFINYFSMPLLLAITTSEVYSTACQFDHNLLKQFHFSPIGIELVRPYRYCHCSFSFRLIQHPSCAVCQTRVQSIGGRVLRGSTSFIIILH